jgi:hypothetical protein
MLVTPHPSAVAVSNIYYRHISTMSNNCRIHPVTCHPLAPVFSLGLLYISTLHHIPTVLLHVAKSWGSSVSVVPDYRQNERGSIPGRGKGFSSSLYVQTSSEAHPAPYNGYRGSFSRGKTRPGRHAGHSPPSSAEVKN